MQKTSTMVILAILLIVLLIAGFATTNPDSFQQVLIDLGIAQPQNQGYILSGMLEAQVTTLSSQSGGKITALPVEEGQSAKQGDTVAQLDAALLEIQRTAAQARLDIAQTQLQMAQNGASQADLLVASNQVNLMQVNVQAAQQALSDAQTLPNDDSSRQSKIALAQAQVNQTQAALSAAQTGLDKMKTGATQDELDAAQAAVSAAQAEVDQLNTQIEALTIAAPLDGVVLHHLAHTGESVAPGQPILSMADLSMLQLTVYVPESDLDKITLGQNVTVKIDAFPNKSFSGKVTLIAIQPEFTPRNVQTPKERVVLVYAVQIDLPNPQQLLKPGLPADAIFEVK